MKNKTLLSGTVRLRDTFVTEQSKLSLAMISFGVCRREQKVKFIFRDQDLET
jgi:hypothetical protein